MSSGFTFGGGNPNTPASAFSFGTPSASQTPGFSFGTPNTAQPAASTPASNVFGGGTQPTATPVFGTITKHSVLMFYS